MPAIKFLIRKMMQNKWLVFSLLAGMIMCTALTSSLPIFKHAILQNMLVKELEHYYVETGQYPGNLHAEVNFGFNIADAERQRRTIDDLDRYWSQLTEANRGLPQLLDSRERLFKGIYIIPVGSERRTADARRHVMLAARTDLMEHVRLVDGRMPNPDQADEVIEVLVTDRTLARLGTVINHELEVVDEDALANLRIRPVGVIAEQDPYDPYWSHRAIAEYDMVLFMDEAATVSVPGSISELPIKSARWYVSYDYRAFDVDSLQHLAAFYKQLSERVGGSFTSQKVEFTSRPVVEPYLAKEARLQSLLWSLHVPLFILVGFYLYMVSGMLVNRQRSELAVLWSRGASRGQIIAIYALESALLAVIAVIIGPQLGAWMTKILGSTDSFMSFVQRQSVSVEVTLESYIHAAIAAICAVFLHMLPLLFAIRTSVVEVKRKDAKHERVSFWHRFGLDVMLIAAGLYGFIHFERKLADMRSLGLDGQQLSAEPFLFIAPSMFIIGVGFLFLRLYPLLLKIVYRLGRSRLPLSFYYSLLLVSRQPVRYHALMIFLILTVGIGIFNASAARTINGNMEDQIRYRNGTDIVLREQWRAEPIDTEFTGSLDSGASGDAAVSYREPPFERYEQSPGVAHAARVFNEEGITIETSDGESGTARLMGISTEEFGLTLKMKDGLLPYHVNEYLNLIAGDPRAVLISTSLSEAYGIEPGDQLVISRGPSAGMVVTVYAAVDYFPTYNPNPVSERSGEHTVVTQPHLIVGHLMTIQYELGIHPYEVWIRLTSSEGREPFYAWLEERQIRLVDIQDTFGHIAESRGDAFRMAMNGAMSLGFIVSLVITFAGFILFWTLTLQGRTLEFGIFRAMGLTKKQLLRLIGVEQLLTSGAGFAIGLAAGAWGSWIFVPLSQMMFDPGRIVPPFEVMIERGDMLQLVIFVSHMLLVALIILMALVRRMKVHQAIKLGEG